MEIVDVTHGAALQQLKEILATAPVLQYFDVNKPTVMQCDAALSGLGACILQNCKPVEYASQSLTATERDTYAQIEKEML